MKELKRRSVESSTPGVATNLALSPEILSIGTDTDEAVTWGSEVLVEERSYANKLTATEEFYPLVKHRISDKQESVESDMLKCSGLQKH